MKHSLKITLIVMFLFFIAQVLGVVITSKYVDYEKTQATGNFTWKEIPSVGPVQLERPQVEEDYSVYYISAGIIIGTLIFFLILKYKKFSLIKAWFFIAVTLCLYVAFGAFVNGYVALTLALLSSVFKIFKPNIFIHNFTELFVYGGLAAIFVPMIGQIRYAIFLLILISLYDMYAVWKSKHMITMAKEQSAMGIFAGLNIPYEMPKKMVNKENVVVEKIKTAILGGGDIGFPLLFTGVVLKNHGLWQAFMITPFTTLGLSILLFIAQKDKFYPAMPFISLGSLLGYLIVLLI